MQSVQTNKTELASNQTFTPLNNNAQGYTEVVQITLYVVIFLLAVFGNLVVIITLAKNKRMRNVTNLFLLNLAISDLLLGVLCMPFTLIGSLLKNFLFGELMCKILPYFQACSVAVSAWTLVAISCERYYAICHPLRSRRWQTLTHAYKVIAVIWIGSLLLMSPIAFLTKLIPISKGRHKCREVWPLDSNDYEILFNIFLDLTLLIIPVITLTMTYCLIIRALYMDVRLDVISQRCSSAESLVELSVTRSGSTYNRSSKLKKTKQNEASKTSNKIQKCLQHLKFSSKFSHKVKQKHHSLRSTNAAKHLRNKRRVIKMLSIVVLEFFICWTPIYIINTMVLFNKKIVYNTLGYSGISLLQLLSYTSCCCNPITYCFMNRGFRKGFFNLFSCYRNVQAMERVSTLRKDRTQNVEIEMAQC